MKSRTITTLALAALMFSGCGFAQDLTPLSDQQVDELREAAQDPLKRLPLYVKFASEKLIKIEDLEGKGQVQNRGQQIHDLLQGFTSLIDEMDDNMDDYAHRGEDMRKALPKVIESQTEFQTRLRALQQTAINDPKAAEESRLYNFALQDAMDAVRSSQDDAQKTLSDQEEQFKELKEKEKLEHKKKKY